MKTTFVSALTLLAFAALPAQAQVRELTLDRAIELGLEHSPDLRMGHAEVEKAHAESWSSLGNMGPKLSVEAGIQYWDKATDVSFIDANAGGLNQAALAADLVKFGQAYPALGGLFGGLMSGLSTPTRVQEQLTGSVSLQVVQPLTPLYSMVSLYKMNQLGEEAAELGQEGTKTTVRFKVAEAFFRVLAAQRMVEVAQKAVEQVEGHIKTARSYYEAGIVGKEDVLRAEAALARAKDGLNQALSGTALARAALNIQVGLPASEATQPTGNYPDNPPEVKVTMEQATERAVAARSELRTLEKRVDMADAGREAQIGTMIPTIAALARYSHNEGSSFQRKDSVFVGAQLQWTFWEWGASYYKLRSIEADQHKATEGLQAARDGITLDVTKAYLDLRQARSSIDMNRSAVQASEEALRVVTKKYEASTATSVEILDAQSSLTQSRAGYEVALFTYYTALANLERAVGSSL